MSVPPAVDLVDGILATLLSPACAACHQPLDRPTRGAVCHACWSRLPRLSPPWCDTCGDPMPSWRAHGMAHGQCPRCRRTPHFIDRARAVGSYDGLLREIIHALKYEGRRSIAGPLSRLMASQAADLIAGADVAIPVPLHRARERQRGFNQADDLARGLGLPVQLALERGQATRPQIELPATRRHANVRHAFATVRGTAVAGCVVVLVDDVATTGATLEACARVLKGAGAAEVRAVTAARVVTARP